MERTPLLVALALAPLAGCTGSAGPLENVEECTFATVGQNPFLPLVPGSVLVLAGELEANATEQTWTVTGQTRVVQGVDTRIVIRETKVDGSLAAISRSLFAVCRQTGTVYLFGEEVEEVRGGKVVGQGPTWLAGEQGAKPGVAMPAAPAPGMRFAQAQATGVAQDEAEVAAMGETIQTPAGAFNDTLRLRVTTPLEPGAERTRWYARGVGLVADGPLELTKREAGS